MKTSYKFLMGLFTFHSVVCCEPDKKQNQKKLDPVVVARELKMRRTKFDPPEPTGDSEVDFDRELAWEGFMQKVSYELCPLKKKSSRPQLPLLMDRYMQLFPL
jgi:hypothetical protein